ncbi:nuclear cap-binding protein subunit 2 [Nematocida sp. LUAm3]|nr:nuclear cap-binding protein subunit 2 [Nematocida sp. LUAm3]KAI5175329.1 nuclear cap-binding protein subunit 2 [Nematocida sp. LUAm2]KAI5177714.1 nuclear cap-binding protein subunit 2 [Nematocida sp. LUAm1]
MDIEASAIQKYLQEKSTTSSYIDRSYKGTQEEYIKEIHKTCTLYIGNLPNTIKEEQIHVIFSLVGTVKRVIMGLDSQKHTPCGFCFVEYFESKHAIQAKRDILKAIDINGHRIYIDLDSGFAENRQFGRGQKGGQVRSEYFEKHHKRRRIE